MANPLRIAHIIYRLDFGGMENGLVNIVNRLPADRFSHAIICLTEATRFRDRIQRDDVEVIEMHKPEGKHPRTYWKVYRELRRLRPDITHTRNLGTVDMAWVAWLAGCARRIHSEHGWTMDDPRGRSGKYRALRRLCDPAVSQYVAVSKDIARWLTGVIGIAAGKVQTLHNGVDLDRFEPAVAAVMEKTSSSDAERTICFGTVGRQEPIKGLDVLLGSLRALLEKRPELRSRIRVIMAGDGPDHERCKRNRDEYGLGSVVECPGAVDDVPALLRQMDFFVQPSLNEGISNTVLEALASGLPIIATDVGGNPELVRDGIEGRLVPPDDVESLRAALEPYIDDDALRRRQGEAARKRAENAFSLQVMTENYDRLYSQTHTAARSAAA